MSHTPTSFSRSTTNARFLWVAVLPLFMTLANPQASFAEKAKVRKSTLVYETDGHYWTVLVVATLLHIPEAKAIAYSSENPDNVINEDGYCVKQRYTFLNPLMQRKLHALTGGNPEKERALSLQLMTKAVSPREKGIAAHRLGDSFAHINDKRYRMYPYIVGHTFHWKEPDKIHHNPEKYLHYVRDLVTALGGPDAQIDMSVFYYIAEAGLSSTSNCAILKAEYNLITNAIAFNIEKGQVAIVETYLNDRICTNSSTYFIHSNTDNKRRVTKTVILTKAQVALSER